MRAEVTFEDLAALPLSDMRTIMPSIYREDLWLIFAGPDSALRDKLIGIYLKGIESFPDYRKKKDRRAFAELEIASVQRLQRDRGDVLEDAGTGILYRRTGGAITAPVTDAVLEGARTRILAAAVAAGEKSEISWPPGSGPVASAAKESAAPAASPPAAPHMPEKLAALLAQPVLQLSAAELIDLFTGLAVIARSEGILVVEEIIPVCRDWLLRIFLDDVVSGMEPELAGKLAETHSDFLLHCEKTRCAMIVRGVECIAAGVHPFLVQDMMHAFFAFTAAGQPLANPPLDEVADRIVELAQKAALAGSAALKDEIAADEPLLKEGVALVLERENRMDGAPESGSPAESIGDRLQGAVAEWLEQYERRLGALLVGANCIREGVNPGAIARRLGDS